MYVLIGAGGHAKVILDILEENKETVIGLIDDNPLLQELRGYPILGSINYVPHLLERYKGNLKFIVSIGDNRVREKISARLNCLKVTFGKAIHPSAVVSPNAFIGEGTVVMPNAVINSSAYVGKHVIINSGAIIEHDCVVEDYAHVSPGVNLAGNVQIGRLSHIGIGSNIIPNIVIGGNSIIGAGAVVTQSIPESVVAVGIPAKVIKRRD
jgi:sugar O-acyltransferase (sialic acid O-acetyltransferase NeuD family)